MNYDIFMMINQMAGHYPFLDSLMVFITKKSLYIYALLLLLMWFKNDFFKRSVLYAVMTGGVALFVNYVISLIYFEPRPFVEHTVQLLIEHAENASFPSNHTTGAFALSIAVMVRHRKMGFVMIVLAALTGISRIFVGVHYPVDVLGGVVVAGLSSLFIMKLSPLLEGFIRFILNLYACLPIVSSFQTKTQHKGRNLSEK